jgi:GxxExxY protein
MTRSLPSGDDAYPHRDLTHQIIAACFRVHNALGYGFLESVYRRALVVELDSRRIAVKQEVRYELTYLGVPIGTYVADIVVESFVIVEVKTGLLLDPIGIPQALNYLSASRLPLGLVVHFGPRVAIKRVVRTNQGHSVFDEQP